MTEEKLKRKFKNQIKKYQSWCTKYGYDSRDPISLLWFFNHKNHAIRIDIKYYIIFKNEKYNILDVIDIFKNNKEEIK